MATRPLLKTLKQKWWDFRSRQFSKLCRDKYPMSGLSIIAQNCIGGIIYHRLGHRFLSPTIDTFIRGEDFCKMCEHPRLYFELDAKALPSEQFPGLDFPVLEIGDIKVFCAHYSNSRDAVTAWNRRRKRVDYSRLFFIGNTWDLLNNRSLIERFKELPCPKLLLSTMEEDRNDPNALFIGDDFHPNSESGFPEPDPLSHLSNGLFQIEAKTPLYQILLDRLAR